MNNPIERPVESNQGNETKALLDKELFERNLEFFAKNHPELGVPLRAMHQPASVIIHPEADTSQLDLWVEDERYYKCDMRQRAQDQVKNILDQPNLLGIVALKSLLAKGTKDDIDSDIDQLINVMFNNFITDHLVDQNLDTRPLYPAH